MSKVVLISPYIIPRRIDFYNKIYHRFKSEGTNFEVIIIKKKPVHRKHKNYFKLMKFSYEFCKTTQIYISKNELALDLTWNLFYKLMLKRPSKIIFEGLGLSYFQAYFFSKIFRVKTIFWNKSSSYESIKSKSFFSLIKKIIINNHNCFLAGGNTQLKYINEYQKKSKIFKYDDTIDTIKFKNNINFNISSVQDKIKILYVGELTPRKNVKIIIDALEILNDKIYELNILGSGSEKNKLFLKAKNLKSKVNFFGFVESSKIYEFFSVSDIQIVPSDREAWGIVVEEGLSSGSYLLVSENVGAKERITLNINGNIFKNNNVKDLIIKLKEAKDKIKEIRSNKLKRAESYCDNYNLEKSVTNFVNIITSF